ncbi:MAG: T9SS type A sorting domain-containing protein [Bacteroidia bacterium]
MNKILLLFSAVLFASAANSQTGSGVILTPDNATLLSGASSANDQSYIATLPTGENIVASHISDGTAEYLNFKKIHTDGSVNTIKNLAVTTPQLLGLTCSASGNFTCLFIDGPGLLKLIKFSPSGSILWQKALTFDDFISSYWGAQHTLTETPSGDYYLMVTNFDFTGLVKIDVNGNIAWSHKMTGPRDTGKCPGFCCAVTQSEGCITTLKDDSYETIINMDGNGNVLWSRSFGDAMYRWTKSIKPDNLGNYYIMGTYGSGGTTYIQKIDANGNFIFAKEISGTTSYMDAYLTASNDFYLLVQSPSFHLAKVGAAGDVMWDRAIGATNAATAPVHYVYFTSTPLMTNLNFLSSMNDGKELLFHTSDLTDICNTYTNGIINTTDDVQILDATIDTTCKIKLFNVTIANTGFGTTATEYYLSSDFCSTLASVQETSGPAELNIFPNPATDQVTVTLGNIKAEPGTILVMYDVTGRKVMESELDNAASITIPTAGFAPGLYNIVISGSDNVLGKQRLMIQK